MQPTTTTDAPDLSPEEQLSRIAANIETYRADIGWTKQKLLNTYPELGSDKPYGKILKGDFRELNIEGRWLPAFLSVWQRLQTEVTEPSEQLVETLQGPMDLVRAYLATRNERGNARFILILGDSGMGKTSSVQVLKAKPYQHLIITVEASAAWAGRGRSGTAGALLRSIAVQLGINDLPQQRDALLNEVVSKLNQQRKALVIEEAHHLCADGINTIKTLINMSPVIVIATALPVLWDRLASSKTAWVECSQLTRNRLAEVIRLSITVADVAHYLRARLPQMEEALALKSAELLMPLSRMAGNWQFINQVTKHLRAELDNGQPMEIATIKNVAAQVQKRR